MDTYEHQSDDSPRLVFERDGPQTNIYSPAIDSSPSSHSNSSAEEVKLDTERRVDPSEQIVDIIRNMEST